MKALISLAAFTLTIGVMFIPGVGSPEAEAGSCSTRKASLPKIQKHCADLNTEVTLEGNPFVYSNPDAGCDLGLSMPGLPNFGDISFGLDSCKILKAVTGDLVRDVNAGFREAVDSSLGVIADDYNDINIDPEAAIIDNVRR